MTRVHESAPRRQGSHAEGGGPETRVEGNPTAFVDATEADLGHLRVTTVLCGGYIRGGELTLETPDLSPDDIRQQCIDRYRDRLSQVVRVAIRAAEDLGRAKHDPRLTKLDFRRYSNSAVTTERAAQRVIEQTFREIGQALHDADAQVVFDG